jgi:hypothetical protein
MASIDHFSMEVWLVADMPTCAGGLGVLAGDMLRSAADLGIPLVGVNVSRAQLQVHTDTTSAIESTRLERNTFWLVAVSIGRTFQCMRYRRRRVVRARRTSSA